MCGAAKVAKQQSKQSQPKRSRVNWSKEPHLAKLRKAVDDWNTKAGDWKPTDRLGEFAQRVVIPLGTLSQYVTVAGGQPKLQVGAGSVGRPSHCNEKQPTSMMMTMVMMSHMRLELCPQLSDKILT